MTTIPLWDRGQKRDMMCLDLGGCHEEDTRDYAAWQSDAACAR